jgi:limonene-1,2-epoxide hydrolase
MDETAESVVRRFLKSWEQLTPDGMASWFAENGVFDDVPRGVHRGREAIRAAAAVYPPTASEITRMVSSDGVVVVERIDRFEYGGKRFAIPIVGVFEIADDGQIVLQRDYYDMKGVLANLEAAGITVAE